MLQLIKNNILEIFCLNQKVKIEQSNLASIADVNAEANKQVDNYVQSYYDNLKLPDNVQVEIENVQYKSTYVQMNRIIFSIKLSTLLML